jgi:hypothetical protein
MVFLLGVIVVLKNERQHRPFNELVKLRNNHAAKGEKLINAANTEKGKSSNHDEHDGHDEKQRRNPSFP